eukprot:361791-Chlamydomonas_euryale.AAC.18
MQRATAVLSSCCWAWPMIAEEDTYDARRQCQSGGGSSKTYIRALYYMSSYRGSRQGLSCLLEAHHGCSDLTICAEVRLELSGANFSWHGHQCAPLPCHGPAPAPAGQ